MAEQTEILNLTIDIDKAVADTAAYQKKVADLKKNLEDLKNSQDATTEEIIKANAEYKVAQNQLRANEKILTQLTQAEQEEAGTLEKLTAKNAELRAERQKLNLTTADGKKRLAEINAEIDANNEAIAESSDTQKKGLMGIGQYSKGVIEGFKGMVKQAWAFVMNPIGATIAAVAAIAMKLYKALTSTGEGMAKVNKITGMLSSVFNGLMKVLSPVANFIADVVIKQFEMLGAMADKALSLVSKGLAALGFDNAAKAVDNFSQSMANTAKAAVELADAEAKLTEQQRWAQKIQLDYQKQAEKLRQQRDDESRSIGDRVKSNEALNQVLKDQLAAEMQIANQALKVAELRIKAEGESNENLDERAEALTRISDIQERITGQESEYLANLNSLRKDQAALNNASQDEKKRIADENKALNEQQLKDQVAASLKALEEELKIWNLTNQSKLKSTEKLNQELIDAEINRLNEQATKEQQILEYQLNNNLITQNEYNIQILELENEQGQAITDIKNQWRDVQNADQITATQLQYEADQALLEEHLFAQLDAQKAAMNEQMAYELDLIDKLAIDKEQKAALSQKVADKYAKAEIAIEKAKTQAKLSLAADFAGNIATIAGEGTAIGKAAAVAQTTISTYQAATGAYAALAGIPVVGPGLGIAAAAAAVVAGLANVKQILSVSTDLSSAASGGGVSAGGGAVASTPTLSLPTASSPTIGQGIVSRETSDNSASVIKQGFAEALQENPLRPTLVVDDVTSAQNTQYNNAKTATI